MRGVLEGKTKPYNDCLELRGIFFFLHIYLFLERGEGKEKERENSMCGCLSTGDLACNPGICPDWESNHQPFGSQAHAQSTELGRPTGIFLFVIF